MTENAKTAEQQQWADIYMRHNFSDTGLYPTNGTLSNSPDIIPAGTQPVSDPGQYISDENWNKDFGGNTYAQLPNYIYIRSKNLGPDTSKGKFYLYYSPASMLLWPTDPLDPKKGWSKNPLTTSTGAEYVEIDIKTNERAVTLDPFRWIPQTIANDHYCLVSRVVTEANPNPIPAPGSLTDFAVYISEHPDMAWRNVTTINPANPVSTRIQTYSQGDEKGEVYIFLKLTNVPLGSYIELSSGTPGPTPPISVPKTEVTSGIPAYGINTIIDANYQTDIAYSWYSNGKTPLPGMKIELDWILLTIDGHKLHARAATLESLGIPAGLRAQVAEGKKGIRLGSTAMETIDQAVTMGLQERIYKVNSSTGSGMTVASVAWAEKATSVYGSSLTAKDVVITNTPETGIITETLTLSQVSPTGLVGDLEVTIDFSVGQTGGTVFVMLTVSSGIPVGSEVWLRSADALISIKKTIESTPITLSAILELDAGYSTVLKLSLSLNGRLLSDTAQPTLTVSAVLQTASDSTQSLSELGMPESGNASGKGILLGKVTTKL